MEGETEMEQTVTPTAALDVHAFEDQLRKAAHDELTKSLSPHTTKAYKDDWADFERFCAASCHVAFPATVYVLKVYCSDRATKVSKSTLNRRIAAISRKHREVDGVFNPVRDSTFRLLMSGLRRKNHTPQIQKKALLVEDLVEILGQIDTDTPQGLRDRALLLIGFAGALRRSELVALNRDDIEIGRQGIVIKIRQSKTDNEGQGQEVAIPRGRRPATCPVTQLEAWLAELGAQQGPIFVRVRRHGVITDQRLSDAAVAVLVKSYVGHAGFEAKDFSGHSLRAGLATSAAMAGQSDRQIMAQTRHKSEAMVRIYIRKGTLFLDNVVSSLNL
jgi:integrase